MYSPHPPEVVTLSRLSSGMIEVPEADASPLSSAPNSPRSSSGAREAGSLYGAAADLLEDLVRANKELQQQQEQQASFSSFDDDGHVDIPLLPRPSDEEGFEPARLPPVKLPEAPFDEAHIVLHQQLNMDEKKEAEVGDELMGKQPQRVNGSISSSTVYTGSSKENTGRKNDDDDESQPPSLAVNRSSFLEDAEAGLEQTTVDELMNNHESATLMTPDLRRKILDEQQKPTPEDPEEEMAAERLRSSKDTTFQEEDEIMNYLETTALMTPIQDLKSPPKVLKQAMTWDTPSTKESIDADGSASPENVAVVEEAEDDESIPLDETAAIEIPSTLRAMVSPDGKLEYPNQEDEDNESDNDETDHPLPHFGVPGVTSLAREFSGNHLDKEKPKGLTPFHPQGAVGPEANDLENEVAMQKPVPLSQRSISEPVVSSGVPSAKAPLKEIASTITDAVDLAASGAAAIVGDLARKAACGSNNYGVDLDPYIMQTNSLVSSFPKADSRPGSVSRSVSDMPRRSQTDLAAASNEWNKYLQHQNGSSSYSTTKSKTSHVDVAQWLGGNNNNNSKEQITKSLYREMTPKKDFQSSEKSAAWLQEEFRRRSTIKQEINEAILARVAAYGNDDDGGESVEVYLPKSTLAEHGDDQNGEFGTALSKALRAWPPSAGASPLSVKGTMSVQSEDDEVAALTTTSDLAPQPRNLPSRQGMIMPLPSDDEGAPKPRRLDYGSYAKDTHSVPSSASLLSEYSNHTAPGRMLPVPSQILASPNISHGRSNTGTDYQTDMFRFANDTRAALRENDTGGREQAMANSRFRSLAISSSVGDQDDNHSIEVMASFHDGPTKAVRPPDGSVVTASSHNSEAAESSDHNFDISTTPVLIHSMDSYLGIAKGDITLSLLNENTGQVDTSKRATSWANRVHGAIWRCRRMRRSMGGFPAPSMERAPNSPPRGRSSLPVDMDKARVAGGVRNVQSTQEAAIGHLKHDEIDEAMELFEDIIFAYYAYFEKSLKAREAGIANGGITDFRPYIGVALHNLGILNLLKGEYKEAHSYFGRAVDNRKACLGEGHPEHVASLVKLATCLYALNEFAEAHAKLEQALVYARSNSRDLEDRMQMAEILNNLGCLAYMCGQPSAAKTFFRESLDVQFGVLSQSLYLSSSSIGHSISLNISITRANIGFVKLVTREIQVAVTAFENALMEQQLLMKGANATIIATMDHLAVANLLNGDPSKAAMMFGRILDLQQKEYGPHDRRCYITVDKINMVKSRGTNFEHAVEELRRTFSIPEEEESTNGASSPKKKEPSANRSSPSIPNQHSHLKAKNQKNKVMKVLTSIRKKKAP